MRMVRLASIARSVIPDACLALLPDGKIGVVLGTTRLVGVDWNNGLLDPYVAHHKVDALCHAIRSAIGDTDADATVAEFESDRPVPDLDEGNPGF